MKKITFSRNVFLPLTHVCGNACGYCSFKEPVADGCVMPVEEVKAKLLMLSYIREELDKM